MGTKAQNPEAKCEGSRPETPHDATDKSPAPLYLSSTTETLIHHIAAGDRETAGNAFTPPNFCRVAKSHQTVKIINDC
jgi:hypothetical protein